MIVKIFWKDGCPNCPTAKELGKKLEERGIEVKYFNVEEADGMAESVYLGFMSTPSIAVIDDSKKAVGKWPGKAPSLDEILSKLK